MKGQLKLTAKNTLFYSLGNFVGKLSGFILLPLYTKYLGADGYGLIGLFESIYLLFLVLSELGIKSALMRWYWDKEKIEKQKSIYFSAFFTNANAIIFVCFISYFIFKFFGDFIFDTPITEKLILLLIFSTIAKIIVDYPQLLLRMQQKALQQTIFQIIILAINISVTSYMLIIRKAGIEGVLIAQLAANGFVFLVQIPLIIKNSTIKLDLKELKEMFKFGSPLYLANIFSYSLILTDKFLITHFNGLSDAGVFNLAYKISSIVHLVFIASFTNAFNHVFYKNISEKEIDNFYSKILNYFAIGISFLGMSLIFFSREVIQLLSSSEPEFWKAYKVVPILIFGFFFTGITSQMVLPIQKVKKTKLISRVTISNAVLLFALNLLLIPKFSSIGAAFANMLSQIFSVGFYIVIFRKHKIINLKYNKLIKILVLNCVFLSLYLITDNFDLICRIILKVILLIGFLISIYFLRFFEKHEIEALKGFYYKWKKPKN